MGAGLVSAPADVVEGVVERLEVHVLLGRAWRGPGVGALELHVVQGDELLVFRRFLGEADQRAHPLDQGLGLEGLEEVVLGARLQLPVLVEGLGRRLGAGDDERDRLEGPVLLEPVAPGIAGEAGQLHAEHHAVGVQGPRELETLLAVRTGADAVAPRLEGRGHRARKGGVALDEEDVLLHAGILWPPRTRSQKPSGKGAIARRTARSRRGGPGRPRRGRRPASRRSRSGATRPRCSRACSSPRWSRLRP